MTLDRMKRFQICERCGKEKKPPRYNTTALCLECEAETLCKHYVNRPAGLIPDDWKCDAGVCLMEITLPREGCMTRIPCRYLRGCTPVTCEKFESVGIEHCEQEDRAHEESARRMMLVLPIIGDIKKQHKGENWQGEVSCPVECGGILHLSHAACNGHVWGRCSTEGCLVWME